MHIERQRGPAAELFQQTDALLDAHERDPERLATLRVLTVTAPVVVLGSSQRSHALASSAHTVVRRSGGGAVLLDCDAMVWLDLLLSRSDSRWNDDVGRAMYWIGDALAGALQRWIPDAKTHRGPLRSSTFSRDLCWLSTGPGEVIRAHIDSGFDASADADADAAIGAIGAAKVVGIAQKRRRNAALFQIGVQLQPRQMQLVSLLGLPADVVNVVNACEVTLRADLAEVEAACVSALAGE